MELIKPNINIDFISRKNIAVLFSALLILIGFLSLLIKDGPNYGIDFAGGTLVQVQFKQDTGAVEIKDALSGLELGSLVIQQFGEDANEFLIRSQNSSAELEGLSQSIAGALEGRYGEGTVEVRRAEMVGPQVGKDLRQKGFKAILCAMIGILIYVSWRFEFRFAIGAIVALVHDVLITLGAFSLFNMEIDLPVIAAFLAIIGYSLNDTIIVYDRIRENMGKHAKDGLPLIITRSINETLSRTILTSGTTMLVVVALFLFGGGVIHTFAFALLVGILAGTYSSIFVASPILIYWEEWKGKKRGKAPAVKGGAA
ncbi:MAG: protein translocase subunit SecF [Desulfuromonadaceae bacterium]